MVVEYECQFLPNEPSNLGANTFMLQVPCASIRSRNKRQADARFTDNVDVKLWPIAEDQLKSHHVTPRLLRIPILSGHHIPPRGSRLERPMYALGASRFKT